MNITARTRLKKPNFCALCWRDVPGAGVEG